MTTPSADTLFAEGLRLARAKDFAAARGIFGEVVRRDEGLALGWYNLGFCCNKLKEYDQAKIAMQRATALMPALAEELRKIGPVLKEYAPTPGASPANEEPPPPEAGTPVQEGQFVIRRTGASGEEEEIPLSPEEAAQLFAGLNQVVAERGYGEADVYDMHRLLRDIRKDDPLELNQRGVKFLEERNPAEALRCFDAVVALDRRAGGAWLNRACALSSFGRHAEALVSFDRGVDLAPHSVEGFYSKGSGEIAAGALSRAAASLTQAQGLAIADNSPLLPRIVEQLTKLSRSGTPLPNLAAVQSAIEGYRQAAMNSDFAGSLPLFDRALTLAPEMALIWQYRAMSLRTLGRHEEALADYRRATEVESSNPIHHFNLGTLCSELKRFDEAAVAYDQCVTLDPLALEGWSNLGNALRMLGHHDPALQCLDRALDLAPLAENVWFNKALTEDLLGRRDAAIRSYGKFLQFNPAGANPEQVKLAEERRRTLEAESQAPSPPPPPPLLERELRVGDVIALRYEVVRVLGGSGRSGMGVVYVCRDRETGAIEALKTFQEHYLNAAEARNGFRKGALTWIRLGAHPHIVRALWYRELDGRPYLALEYVPPDDNECTTLTHHLRREIPLPQALRWGIDLCRGMEHAHSRGVLPHRDLKPDNLLIGGDGRLMVSDFDLAGLWDQADVSGFLAGLDDGALEHLTFIRAADGAIVCGTAPWMAPEQFAGSTSERSDIYACGIILYQLVHGGSLPYAPQVGEAWSAVHTGARLPTINSPLAAVITRCLAKEPAGRFSGFSDLRLALEDLHQQHCGPLPTPLLGTAASVAELRDRALSLVHLGFGAEGLKELEDVRQWSPDDPETLWPLALTLEAAGEENDARINLIAFLRCASADDPRRPQALELIRRCGGAPPEEIAAAREHYQRALVLRKGGDQVGAESALREALAADPDLIPAIVVLAQLMAQQRADAEAIALVEDGLRRDPRQRILHYTLGLLHRRNQRPRQARIALEAFLRHALAEDRERVSQIEPVVAALRQEEERQQREAADLVARAQESEDATAIPLLRQALALTPDAPPVLASLGLALLADGDQTGAAETLRRALYLDPGQSEAREGLDEILRRENPPPAAASPPPPVAPSLLEETLGELITPQMKADAERASRALEMVPQTPAEHLYQEGVHLRLMMQIEAAIARFEEALRLTPDYADARSALDEARSFLQGQGEDLRRQVGAALDGNDPDALFRLALQLIEQGRSAEGIRYLETYLARAPADHDMRDLAEDILGDYRAIHQPKNPAPAFAPSQVAPAPKASPAAPPPRPPEASPAKAASRPPQSAEDWFLVGCRLRLSGDEAKARYSFQRALSLDPAHAKAREALEGEPPWPKTTMFWLLVATFFVPLVGLAAGGLALSQGGRKKRQGVILIGIGVTLAIGWLVWAMVLRLLGAAV